MKNAFRRCGSEDGSYSPILTLSSDVCQASGEILSAFSQWAKTHLYACGNNQLHTERMDEKWSNIYNQVLGCDDDTYTSTTTTFTTRYPPEDGNPNTHRNCEITGGWTAECPPEQCYPYVHETYDYYYLSYDDVICEYTVSSVCDPNFVDRHGNGCDSHWYEDFKSCEELSNDSLLYWGIFTTAEGFKTGLNCPSCGCGENGPINMSERVHIRSLTGDLMKTKKN